MSPPRADIVEATERQPRSLGAASFSWGKHQAFQTALAPKLAGCVAQPHFVGVGPFLGPVRR
jgi:hypothetical protein